jgi:hypothetical protein
LNPFDVVKSINEKSTKLNFGDEESKYPAFMVNRGLSFFQDTVILANEMNRCHHIDGQLQYDFLRGIVRKRKRFSKWAKKVAVKDVEVVKEYYGYTDAKAESVMDLLCAEDILEMKAKLSKGGKG